MMSTFMVKTGPESRTPPSIPCLLLIPCAKQDAVLAAAAPGTEPSRALSLAKAAAATNFDDIDEEDKAGRKTRLFKRNETQGYLDLASLEAASVDKVSCIRVSAFDRVHVTIWARY